MICGDVENRDLCFLCGHGGKYLVFSKEEGDLSSCIKFALSIYDVSLMPKSACLSQFIIILVMIQLAGHPLF